MITRKLYISQIEKFLNAPVIKIITGMRRIGKSTILNQLKEQLLESGISKENIVHINMELFSFSHIKTAADLHHYISEALDGRERGKSTFSLMKYRK